MFSFDEVKTKKMKARFTKGQEIYRIHITWSIKEIGKTVMTYMKITKEIVDSCGQKKLTISGDSLAHYRMWNPNVKYGYMERPCVIFHETLEKAINEANEYAAYHSGKFLDGMGRTYYLELINE